MEEILKGTVDLIPPAWQYPETACARLVLEGQEFRTENFAQSPWQQTAGISVDGEPCGALHVGYLQERPESDHGPFLEEETDLLELIARRLGEISDDASTMLGAAPAPNKRRSGPKTIST